MHVINRRRVKSVLYPVINPIIIRQLKLAKNIGNLKQLKSRFGSHRQVSDIDVLALANLLTSDLILICRGCETVTRGLLAA